MTYQMASLPVTLFLRSPRNRTNSQTMQTVGADKFLSLDPLQQTTSKQLGSGASHISLWHPLHEGLIVLRPPLHPRLKHDATNTMQQGGVSVPNAAVNCAAAATSNRHKAHYRTTYVTHKTGSTQRRQSSTEPRPWATCT